MKPNEAYVPIILMPRPITSIPKPTATLIKTATAINGGAAPGANNPAGQSNAVASSQKIDLNSVGQLGGELSYNFIKFRQGYI
jgi:hypothetical protein